MNGNENLPMHFIPDHFQNIVVALGKVVFSEVGFIQGATTTTSRKIFSFLLFRAQN
jgi:hypothetical protein